jgi:chloride channel 3/4/5
MSHDEGPNEHTRLLDPRVAELSSRRSSRRGSAIDAASIISSYVSKAEQELAGTAVGERLPYNDYTTIDWLHDLVSSTYLRTRISLIAATDQRFF